MRLQREVSLGIGGILALQILISMLAIGLLTRMGPAIERILQENVYSGEAVEEMLSQLASTPHGKAPPNAFTKALTRARSNVTEKAEKPLLAIIKKHHVAAFKGRELDRLKVITALRELGKVNRNSMTRADHQAKRMGYAGAWAFAMLGALALALGIIVYRRLRQRLEQPIHEIVNTTQRIRTGNLHARCPSNEWPQEVKQIASDLNWLLDRWLHSTQKQETDDTEIREAEIRRTLAWLLDQDPTPSALIDTTGQRILMSHNTIDLDLPRDGVVPGEDDLSWKYTKIPNTSLRLIQYTAPPPSPPTSEPPAQVTQPGNTAQSDTLTPDHNEESNAQPNAQPNPGQGQKPKAKQKRKRKKKRKK